MFALGRTVATPGALRALEVSGQTPGNFLDRHAAGDWGDIDPEDRGINEQALVDGNRLLSVYTTAAGERIWIITEWDRSVITLLLPEDY